MDFDRLRSYLVSLPGAVEERHLAPQIPVYKVKGRMFAHLAPDESPPRLAIRLDPRRGRLLRAAYRALRPACRANKDHWNSVALDGSVPEKTLLAWIDESYKLVVDGLPAHLRNGLAPGRPV